VSEKRRPFFARPGRTLFRLLLAALIVGLLLSLFDLRPEELLRALGDSVADAFGSAVALVRWAIPYLLLGAVVVAPIWLVMTLWRAIRGK
jgi:hypothetical protein